jgi:hypothetical protein
MPNCLQRQFQGEKKPPCGGFFLAKQITAWLARKQQMQQVQQREQQQMRQQQVRKQQEQLQQQVQQEQLQQQELLLSYRKRPEQQQR